MSRRVLAAALVLMACNGKLADGGAPDPSVHSIALPSDDPPLAAGQGQDAFDRGCRICHSARYISLQPVFPRKTWTAEVDKMMKVYGAPIPPNDVKPIIDYLVATHGVEE